MKTQNALAAAILVLLIAACVPSVYPFYTEKDLVFDDNLLGAWTDKDPGENAQTWTFQKKTDTSYTLSITETARKGQFEARLFKLENKLFLDLMASDAQLETNQVDIVGASLIPGHLLARVSQLTPNLQLAFTDPDWLGNYLEKNPKEIAFIKSQDRLVFTAPTKELQSFVLRHLGTNELFGEPGELIRKDHNGK